MAYILRRMKFTPADSIGHFLYKYLNCHMQPEPIADRQSPIVNLRCSQSIRLPGGWLSR